MKILQYGLTSLCLLMLTACSKAPVQRTELMQVNPPAILLREVVQPRPPSEGAVNLDLLLYAVDLELALAEANNDKAALRELFGPSPP